MIVRVARYGLVALLMTVSASRASALESRRLAPEVAVVEAARKGDVAALKALIGSGADVNQAYGDGRTALHWAADRGDAESTALLLAAGASVRAPTRIGRYTPLHLASRSGSVAVIKLLIEAGADVDAVTTNTGATPLHLAAMNGNPQAVALLLEHGARVDATDGEWGHTPLVFAAAYNRPEAIKVLLAHGAAVNAKAKALDMAHEAAVDQAAERKMWDMLRQFMAEEGATDADAWRPSFSQLRVAIGAARDIQKADTADLKSEEAFDRIKYFNDVGDGLSRRVNIRQAKEVGKMGGLAALHHAVRNGNMDAALTLLDAGADIEATTADGSTPLLIATMNGQFDVAMMLLKHGANPNRANTVAGMVPLFAVLNAQWAPKSRHAPPAAPLQQKTSYIEMMTALLDAGADPNARFTGEDVWFSSKGTYDPPMRGATPFFRAAFALDVDAMRLLMSYGADPTIPTLTTRSGEGPGPGRRRGAGDAAAGPPTLVNAAYPIHAVTGLGYGDRAAGNSHRYAPDAWMTSMKYLVEELGADVTARDDSGYTPLHNAAARGDKDAILYLLSKGADIKALSKRGQTVADMANAPHQRARPMPEIVALLESLGSGNNHNCMTC